MKGDERSDALIIGAGHNGLVCASYLAAKGPRVRMLERRAVIGGAAVTEEFHPGFRNSTASYTVSLLHPQIVRDLRLAQHGLTIVQRPLANFLPLPDGDYLQMGGGLAASQAEVARHSRRDAEALPTYYRRLERIADVLRELVLETPPNGWSRAPIIELLVPSTLDATLAPAGRHVASLICQHFRYALPPGQQWDDVRERAADGVIDTVNRYAPNFGRAIIAREIHSPLDLERKFGLVGGDIFHGKLSLNQLFSARPALGSADYRMPIPGLYLCGAGAHPGGGVTGAPGHNAAREVWRDRRLWGRG